MRPHFRRLMAALALAALTGSTGCFREITDTVRVLDPHQVRVTRANGEEILHAGVDPVVVPIEGASLGMFTRTPYPVLLQRGAAGELTLRCDGCGGQSLTLLNAAGGMTPVTYGSIFPEPSRISLDERGVVFEAPTCIFSRGRHCKVGADTLLATPWSNVADVQRVRFASPALGVGLLGAALIPLSVGTAVAAIRNGDLRVQVPGAAAFLTPGVVLVITGIYNLVAPRIEEHADATHPLPP